MASTEVNIWKALKNRVDTFSATPALTVVYPKETAPAGRHLRVQNLPNRVARFGVPSDGTNQRSGILQISVLSPVTDKGAAEVDMEIAGQVAAHFSADLLLFFGGVKVRITRPPDVAQAYRDDQHWRTPVSIYYEAMV